MVEKHAERLDSIKMEFRFLLKNIEKSFLNRGSAVILLVVAYFLLFKSYPAVKKEVKIELKFDITEQVELYKSSKYRLYWAVS